MCIGDTCDRHPSAAAMTAWYRSDLRGVLTFCAHCTHDHDVALTEQGFELRLDDRASLIPEPA